MDLPVRIEDAVSAEGRGAGTLSSFHELGKAVPGIIGFGISFAVIGLFWLCHHGLFRYVTAFDRRLMLLNLLFLGTIAFLPYPTALLSGVSVREAEALEVEEGDPLMLVERTAYSRAGQPLEYARPVPRRPDPAGDLDLGASRRALTVADRAHGDR